MGDKLVIGKYFTDKKDATEYAKKQEKALRKKFTIIMSSYYLVVAERQLNGR